MKKLAYIFFLAAALLMAGSCKNDDFDYPGSGKTGTLSFGDLSLSVSDDLHQVSTRATAAAGDDYVVTIYDNTDKEVWKKTYKEASSAGLITLPVGDYTLTARSTSSDVPEAEFENPVYGVSKEFTIEPGSITQLDTLTCTLLQAVVTVGYNDEFLKALTGDCNTSVELTSGYPLNYALSYSDGNISYENRKGYFAVNSDDATIVLTVKGSVDGKSQRMKTTITGVKAMDWHKITIMKKVDASGNASFSIEIDGLVEDVELESEIVAKEEGDGYDPNTPEGDGDIELVSTCDYDITQPVTVPATGSFPLTMTAKVPNGVRKFTVDIDSTNEDFVTSVNLVGGTTLDLVNPSDAALGIFDIVPFPHGSDLAGKTAIDFDLSGAQVPLLAFSGTHTFTMNVVDMKGCHNSIAISLKVL